MTLNTNIISIIIVRRGSGWLRGVSAISINQMVVSEEEQFITMKNKYNKDKNIMNTEHKFICNYSLKHTCIIYYSVYIYYFELVICAEY